MFSVVFVYVKLSFKKLNFPFISLCFCTTIKLASKLSCTQCSFCFKIANKILRSNSVNLDKHLAPIFHGVWSFSQVHWLELALIWCNLKLTSKSFDVLPVEFHLVIWHYTKLASILANLLATNVKYHQPMELRPIEIYRAECVVHECYWYKLKTFRCNLLCTFLNLKWS